MEFYYFMEHDYNNDTRLDGLEILAAVKHSSLGDEINSNITIANGTRKENTEKELNIYTGKLKNFSIVYLNPKTKKNFILRYNR